VFFPAHAIKQNSLNSAPDAEELSASRLYCCAAPLEESPHSQVGPKAGLDIIIIINIQGWVI